MKRNLIACLALAAMAMLHTAKAQFVTSGAASTTPLYTGGNVGIGNYFNYINPPTAPSSTLELNALSNPTLNITSMTGNQPGTTTQIQSGTETIKFSKGNTPVFQINHSWYPACGTDQLHIGPVATGQGIHLSGSTIVFSKNQNFWCSTGLLSGSYIFDGQIGTSSLLISSNSSPGMSLPTGYKFAVQGNSNFNGLVAIGDLSTMTTPNIFNASSNVSGYNLFVSGGILTERIKVAVKSQADWKDMVFDSKYKLRSLGEVEQYVKEYKHLPEIPSAEEIVKSGVDVAEMDAKLLQKIEELTLYAIEMKKELEVLKKERSELKNQK